MDGPLDDKMGAEKQCRYGERCTRCMSPRSMIDVELTDSGL
jgi:hypothetical protein